MGYEDPRNLYQYVLSRPLAAVDPSGMICEHLCAIEHSAKDIMPVDIRFHNRLAAMPPGTAEGLAVPTEQFITILKVAKKLPGGNLPGGKQLLKLLTKAGNAAVDNALALGGGLKAVNGVAIWIYVQGKCCEWDDCCVIYERLEWKQRGSWVKCSASGPIGDRAAPGFAIGNQAAIKKALPQCVISALKDFDCP